MSTRGKIAVLVTKDNFNQLKKLGFKPILKQYLCLWVGSDAYPEHMVPAIKYNFAGADGALKLVKKSKGAYISYIGDWDGEMEILRPKVKDFEYQTNPIHEDWRDAEYLYYFNGKHWKVTDGELEKTIPRPSRPRKNPWQIFEANKYFFGTEDTDEVKRLFESWPKNTINEFFTKLQKATKQSLIDAKYKLLVLNSYLHSSETRNIHKLYGGITGFDAIDNVDVLLDKHYTIPKYTSALFDIITKRVPDNFSEFDSTVLVFSVNGSDDAEKGYYDKPGREIQKSLTIIRNDLKKSFSKFFDVKDLYLEIDRYCYTVFVCVDYKV